MLLLVLRQGLTWLAWDGSQRLLLLQPIMYIVHKRYVRRLMPFGWLYGGSCS